MISWLISWQGLLDLTWLVFLLAMLFYFWNMRRGLAQARFWQVTQGHITLFEWTKEGRRLWPKIEYHYDAYDQEFRSEALFLDILNSNPNSKYARQIAYKAAIAYEENAAIDVYYNPSNPQQAVLDVKIPRKLNLIVVLLLLLILFHLLMISSRWL